jgi:hypothetical protein
MTTEDIRKLCWADPFLPFQLILNDNREVLVAKRSHLSIAPTGNRIIVWPRMEDIEIIEVNEVKGVRTSGSTLMSTSESTNGAA